MEDRIKNVLNYIEENLDARLELDELAALARLSPSQFHRQFKKQTGRTPFKFVEELRMNKSYQLIMDGRLLIGALSLKMGYRDYETFSRTFKKYFHFSPDDLKAIVERVKTQVASEGQKEVMVLTLNEGEGMEDAIEQLRQFLKEKNVSNSDLLDAEAFKILPKIGAPKMKDHLIKNKFALHKEDMLWKTLIESNDRIQKNRENE